MKIAENVLLIFEPRTGDSLDWSQIFTKNCCHHRVLFLGRRINIFIDSLTTIDFLLSSKWNSNKHQIGKTIPPNPFMSLNIPSAENPKRENKPFEKIEGICWVPSWSSYNLHFALSYHVRSDDIFIVAYPRSGTTWMQNIVYKLQTGTQPFDANI